MQTSLKAHGSPQYSLAPILSAVLLLHAAAGNVLVLKITHWNTSCQERLRGCFGKRRQEICESGFELCGKARARCFHLAGALPFGRERAFPPAGVKWWERAKGGQRIKWPPSYILAWIRDKWLITTVRRNSKLRCVRWLGRGSTEMIAATWRMLMRMLWHGWIFPSLGS